MARIVIADDDADIRELVVFKLRHGGHEVVPVGDGAAAVEACTAEKPDLVILDVMMPGMSGLDAARALRQDSALEGPPRQPLGCETRRGPLAALRGSRRSSTSSPSVVLASSGDGLGGNTWSLKT